MINALYPADPETEPEPEPEPEPDADDIARTHSHKARESRLAAVSTSTAAATNASDDGDGTVTSSDSLATDFKWQLQELEHHMIHERGVAEEAVGEMWKEVALLIRGTLVRNASPRCHACGLFRLQEMSCATQTL